MVFLLLFRLPTAVNLHDKPPFYWLWEKKEKDPNEGRKENGEHVVAMMKIGEWQCVAEFFALLAYPSFLADKIGNKNLH